MHKLKFWTYKEDYFPEILPIIWENPLHGVWEFLYFWIPYSIEEVPDQLMSESRMKNGQRSIHCRTSAA